jgi:branched-subunit amino acid transport protein AzlD
MQSKEKNMDLTSTENEAAKKAKKADKWADKPAMEVRDLHFAYGKNKVLKGVSLKIEEGKITTYGTKVFTSSQVFIVMFPFTMAATPDIFPPFIEFNAQDKARKHRKTAKAAISFIVMILLLVALFFAAVNIGSLKVSFPELLKGLFVEYNEDVATIYDLRFPRIVISMLAGAAIAVSGVLFQAVLKNPLADPGIIGISSGASFAAVLITALH